MDREAKENKYSGKNQYTQSLPESGSGTPREVAQQIADKAGVSRSTVYSVHAIRKDGVPELNEMVMSGELVAKSAEDFVKHIPDKQKQKELIQLGGIGAVKDVAREIRACGKELSGLLTGVR